MTIVLKIFLILTIFLSGTSESPDKLRSKWNKEVLERANTAADVSYLTQQEKDIIFYTNLARMDGDLFIETYLEDYLVKNKIKSSRWVTSLKRDLKKAPTLPPMQPQPDLSEVAKGHAKVSGKKGTVGHQHFKSRVKPVASKYLKVGENCQYGYADGLSIVMDLLIDENISDLGHRKNILDPGFVNIGVSIQPHKKYKVNSVMIYGGLEANADLSRNR